ncbi:helix-turn-helix domain-containing protein [Ornithinibacillus halotolerans]|uniref:Transcriptional regulator n=1 Tax=Ornithinibacillus halotolerans TaxID=1274357 RepID=A0A916RVC1_9BACI|nr:Rgg/GadR/MutR family transcriptional regulator [Ornithinibacillus halotolerans]GGA72437.1 transcriptional regulator [Ornithinibacillus halotolerans]
MITYGKTLREIRKQKGVTLKELADGICSVSFLSKFETDASDITLGLFTRILDKLMLTMDEFLFIHNDFQPSQLEQFFKKVKGAYFSRNATLLKELKEEELRKWKQYGVETYHCNALMIQVSERIVSKKIIDEDVQAHDIKVLTDYLFQVEVWGYYELMLYNGTILLLQPEMAILLSRTAYEKSARYQEFDKVKVAISSVLFNTIIFLLGPVNRFEEPLTYEKEIAEFLSYLEQVSISERNLLERIQLMELKGAYELRSGNKRDGIAKIEEAVLILNKLKAHQLAKNMESYLQQIIDFSKG